MSIRSRRKVHGKLAPVNYSTPETNGIAAPHALLLGIVAINELLNLAHRDQTGRSAECHARLVHQSLEQPTSIHPQCAANKRPHILFAL
jgi:hypothetical protein